MRKRKILTLILLCIFFAGLSVLLYPAISSFWNAKTQSRAVGLRRDCQKSDAGGLFGVF